MDKIGLIKKKKTKFILSLLSGVIFSSAQSVVLASTSFSVYMLSYIHHKDKWVDMQYGNIMMPLIGVFMSLFSPLSGPIEKLFGSLISMIIGSIIIEISLILFYFQRNIWIYYSISLLAGLGVGISGNIAIKNSCFYYPKKKGLISGFVASFMGISTGVFIIIGETVINPEKKGLIDENSEPFYPENVSEKIKNFYFLAILVSPIEYILSFILFYKYNPNCEIEGNENRDLKVTENDGENEKRDTGKKIELKVTLMNDKMSKLNSFNKKAPFKNVIKALKNFRFWRNIFIIGIMPLWIFFIQSSFRAYVVMIGVDTTIIYYLGSGLSLMCLLSPLWAHLVDIFGFQPIMKIIGFICCIMPIYFYFFMGNTIFYPIGLVISFTMLMGIASCTVPHLMQIYGIRYYLIIGGLSRLFNEIANFLAALTSIILSIFYKNGEELLFPYRMIMVGGEVLSIIGFIMIFFENDEKFIYGDENEEVEDNEFNNNPNTMLNGSQTTA